METIENMLEPPTNGDSESGTSQIALEQEFALGQSNYIKQTDQIACLNRPPESIEEVSAVVENSRIIQNLATNNRQEELVSLGFPEDCTPIIQLFAERGPRILGSFTHPCQFTLKSLKGALLIQDMIKKTDLNEEDVLVISYETIEPDATLTSPMNIADIRGFGFKNGKDPLSIKLGRRRSPDDAAATMIQQISKEIDEIAEENRLSMNKSAIKVLRKNVSLRLAELSETIPMMFVNDLQFQKSINNTKQVLNQKIMTGSNFEYILRFSGEKTLLENTEYLQLIQTGVNILIDSRGASFLKSLIQPDQALAKRYGVGGEELLTKTRDNQLAIKSGKQITVISETKAIEFLGDSIPLARLECLVTTASGQVIDAGSTYDLVQNAATTLGFSNIALNNARNMKLGSDEQFNRLRGVQFDGTPLSLQLLITFFGYEGVRELVTSPSINFSSNQTNDLKQFLAYGLMNEFRTQQKEA